jgi:single stranded DNA-binding protein
MASDTNVIVMTGRLVNDPETKDVGDQKVTEFRFAWTTYVKGADASNYISCVMWGKEGLIQYLGKGKKIILTGSLHYREWVAGDGSKRSVHEIRVRDIDPFFGNPKAETPVKPDEVPF